MARTASKVQDLVSEDAEMESALETRSCTFEVVRAIDRS